MRSALAAMKRGVSRLTARQLGDKDDQVVDRPLVFSASFLILVLVLAACGAPVTPDHTQSTPSASAPPPAGGAPATPPSPAPTTDPAASVGRRDAYIESMCPTFRAILALDPRLADVRAAGATGGDVSAHGAEIESIAGELRLVLNDLDAVPDWTPGRLLRIELILALHRMRSALLLAARNLDRSDAAERLAQVPYIAGPRVDRGMAEAVDAGLNCSGLE